MSDIYGGPGGTTKARAVPWDLVRELKRGFRSLVRAPGFTIPSVITLAVGFAATASIVTLVDTILVRPLPYPSANRVVRVSHTFKEGGGNPLARFAFPFIRDESHSFEAMGGYWSPARYTLSGDVAAERVTGVMATAGLLDVLGAQALAGRLFTEEDATLRDGSGVVLSQRLWERRYGSDRSLIGRTIEIDGTRREVLGVVVSGVELPESKVDLWIPYTVSPGTRVDDAFRINVLARLRPGVTLAAADKDLGALTQRFPEFAPFYRDYLTELGLSTHVRLVRDEVVGEVERPLWILLGAVLIVLLVATANVATLFVVRAEGRRQEVAVRAALGAGRAGLVNHFVAESVWIALGATAGGLVLAVGAISLFTSLAPPSVPRLDDVVIGGRTVGAMLVLSVFIAVALGLYPSLRFGRRAGASLRGRQKGESRAQSLVAGGLVVAQVAFALVLLSGSALLLRTFRALRAVDPGFDPNGVLVAEFSLPEPSYPTFREVRVFQDRLLEVVAGLQGVQAAALGESPLNPGGCNGLYVEGMVIPEGQFPPCVPVVFVTPGYWELLGIRPIAGRTLSAPDLGGPGVAVVSGNVAQRLFADNPLAAAVHPAPRHGPPWFRIVGVTQAIRGKGPDQPFTEAIYLPVGAMAAEGWLTRTGTLLVKTEPGHELDLADGVRRAITVLDPSVPLTVVGSLAERQAATVSSRTFTLYLLSAAAATALVLGMVGLYGIVAYRVGMRRGEIGLRMAIGAPTGQVRNLVLGHSMRLVATGIILGLAGSAVLTRALSSLLFGVRAGDPLTLTIAAAALLSTALAASWIPAQRATRVDPAVALRIE